MKFGRFLSKVQKIIQNEVEIDLRTIRLVIVAFEECLSSQRKERWSTELEMIKSYKSVQNKL